MLQLPGRSVQVMFHARRSPTLFISNCVVSKNKFKYGSEKLSQRLGERFSFSAAV